MTLIVVAAMATIVVMVTAKEAMATATSMVKAMATVMAAVPTMVTMATRDVSLFGFLVWYWLAFSWYFPNRYQRKTW